MAVFISEERSIEQKYKACYCWRISNGIVLDHGFVYRGRKDLETRREVTWGICRQELWLQFGAATVWTSEAQCCGVDF